MSLSNKLKFWQIKRKWAKYWRIRNEKAWIEWAVNLNK